MKGLNSVNLRLPSSVERAIEQASTAAESAAAAARAVHAADMERERARKAALAAGRPSATAADISAVAAGAANLASTSAAVAASYDPLPTAANAEANGVTGTAVPAATATAGPTTEEQIVAPDDGAIAHTPTDRPPSQTGKGPSAADASASTGIAVPATPTAAADPSAAAAGTAGGAISPTAATTAVANADAPVPAASGPVAAAAATPPASDPATATATGDPSVAGATALAKGPTLPPPSESPNDTAAEVERAPPSGAMTAAMALTSTPVTTDVLTSDAGATAPPVTDHRPSQAAGVAPTTTPDAAGEGLPAAAPNADTAGGGTAAADVAPHPTRAAAIAPAPDTSAAGGGVAAAGVNPLSTRAAIDASAAGDGQTAAVVGGPDNGTAGHDAAATTSEGGPSVEAVVFRRFSIHPLPCRGNPPKRPHARGQVRPKKRTNRVTVIDMVDDIKERASTGDLYTLAERSPELRDAIQVLYAAMATAAAAVGGGADPAEGGELGDVVAPRGRSAATAGGPATAATEGGAAEDENGSETVSEARPAEDGVVVEHEAREPVSKRVGTSGGNAGSPQGQGAVGEGVMIEGAGGDGAVEGSQPQSNALKRARVADEGDTPQPQDPLLQRVLRRCGGWVGMADG